MDDSFCNFVNNLNNEITNNQLNTKPDSVKRKLKLMIVSTHINQINGYSKVIYNIIQVLSKLDWLELTHFGIHKLDNGDIGRKYPSNVKVIEYKASIANPTNGSQPNPFCFQELMQSIRAETPDIVLLYNDVSVVCAYIEEFRKSFPVRNFKIWTYLDLFYNSCPQMMMDVINRDVERVFVFTKKWKEFLKSSGITRPVDIMTHAIDPMVFRTIPKELARQNLGLPKEMFLFMSLNRNQPRKRLDLMVMAFVELITRYPLKPIFMLLCVDKGERGGYQLFDIFARELKLKNAPVEQFGNRLMITSNDVGYKDEDINLFYNIADAGVSCSEGEGFGLCSFEQMAVGVPQIVPNINGYNEYCNRDNSLLIDPSYRNYIPQAYNIVTGEAQIVDYMKVAEAMERYVLDESLRKEHGKQAKETVRKYTWDTAVKQFVKRLADAHEEDDD